MSLRKARRVVAVGDPVAGEVDAHGKIEGAFSTYGGTLRPVEIAPKVIADSRKAVRAPAGSPATLWPGCVHS